MPLMRLATRQKSCQPPVGMFFFFFLRKVIQWDKRPLYVPNFRIVQMLVQNNSRMTNRRVRFDFKLRLQDIPKVLPLGGYALTKQLGRARKFHDPK